MFYHHFILHTNLTALCKTIRTFIQTLILSNTQYLGHLLSHQCYIHVLTHLIHLLKQPSSNKHGQWLHKASLTSQSVHILQMAQQKNRTPCNHPSILLQLFGYFYIKKRTLDNKFLNTRIHSHVCRSLRLKICVLDAYIGASIKYGR